jgi:hypothetical protein
MAHWSERRGYVFYDLTEGNPRQEVARVFGWAELTELSPAHLIHGAGKYSSNCRPGHAAISPNSKNGHRKAPQGKRFKPRQRAQAFEKKRPAEAGRFAFGACRRCCGKFRALCALRPGRSAGLPDRASSSLISARPRCGRAGRPRTCSGRHRGGFGRRPARAQKRASRRGRQIERNSREFPIAPALAG